MLKQLNASPDKQNVILCDHTTGATKFLIALALVKFEEWLQQCQRAREAAEQDQEAGTADDDDENTGKQQASAQPPVHNYRVQLLQTNSEELREMKQLCYIMMHELYIKGTLSGVTLVKGVVEGRMLDYGTFQLAFIDSTRLTRPASADLVLIDNMENYSNGGLCVVLGKHMHCALVGTYALSTFLDELIAGQIAPETYGVGAPWGKRVAVCTADAFVKARFPRLTGSEDVQEKEIEL